MKEQGVQLQVEEQWVQLSEEEKQWVHSGEQGMIQ